MTIIFVGIFLEIKSNTLKSISQLILGYVERFILKTKKRYLTNEIIRMLNLPALHILQLRTL